MRKVTIALSHPSSLLFLTLETAERYNTAIPAPDFWDRSYPAIFMPASIDPAAAAAVPADSTPAAAAASPEDAGEATVLAWRVHRLREEPKKIRLVAAGYAAALALWWLLFPHPLALFLPLIALTSALAEYLFPIKYRLTTQGAYADCGPTIRLFIAWKDVRRATQGSEGIFLSPFARESRLDGVRGVRLRYRSVAAGSEDMPTPDSIRETVIRLWRGVGGEGENAE